jgi:hypothetical protein
VTAPATESTRATLLALATVFLGQAIQANNGNGAPEAWPFLVGTLLATALAALGKPWTRLERLGDVAPVLVLGVGLAIQFAQLATHPPGYYIRPIAGFREFFAVLAAAAVVSGAALASRPVLGRYHGPLLVALFAVAAWWVLRASFPPSIDVFVFQQESSRALISGRNPYALTFPNIYGGTAFYGPGTADQRTVFIGFPYLPLSLLLALPGWLLAGDYRAAQVVACGIATAAMLAPRRGRLPLLAVATLLFTPRMFFVLEQGWTEPFGVALFALLLVAMVRRTRLQPLALGLLLAWKQYTIFLIPLAALLFPRPLDWRAYGRTVLQAVAVATLVTLPFFLWDPAAFWRSVVHFQFVQPFRTEALDFPAWWVSLGHAPFDVLPWMLGATVVALMAVLLRPAAGPAGFSAAVALVYGAFFAFSKQSFCNYWWFMLGVLACGLAACRVEPEPPAISDR